MHCTDDATAGRIDFHATASHTHTQHTFVIESLVNYVIRSHSKATIDRRCQSQKLEKCKTKFMINVIEVHCMNWCARVQNCASICKRSLKTCTGFVCFFYFCFECDWFFLSLLSRQLVEIPVSFTFVHNFQYKSRPKNHLIIL